MPRPHVGASFLMDASTMNAAESVEIKSVALELVQGMLQQLPSVAFYVKDRTFRYVCGNAAMYELCGVQTEAELIGRSSRDFFPELDVRRYETSDRNVLRSGQPTNDILSYTLRLRGPPVWLLCRRWPVKGLRNDVIGVAALARILDSPDRRHPMYQRVAAAVETIKASYRERIDVADLAQRAGVSISQLERDFVDLFGLTPRDYLTKVRFEAALEMLNSSASIAEIAHACGYSDQSAFARRFRAAIGTTPSEYRRIVAERVK